MPAFPADASGPGRKLLILGAVTSVKTDPGSGSDRVKAVEMSFAPVEHFAFLRLAEQPKLMGPGSLASHGAAGESEKG